MPADSVKNLDVAPGLYLEGRKALLRWGLSINRLTSEAPPDYWIERDGAEILAWNDQVWDGIECQITTEIFRSQPLLLGVTLNSIAQKGIEFPSLQAWFAWLQDELVKRFGATASHDDDGEAGTAIWQIDGVTIRHEYLDAMNGYHRVLVFTRE
jgi:hypothetical protein